MVASSRARRCPSPEAPATGGRRRPERGSRYRPTAGRRRLRFGRRGASTGGSALAAAAKECRAAGLDQLLDRCSPGTARPPGRRPPSDAGNSRARRRPGRSRASTSRRPRSPRRARSGSPPPGCRASAAARRRRAGAATAGRGYSALADIDVAEPGDHALVEQRRLDRRRLAGEHGARRRRRETGIERLGPEPGEQRMRLRLAAAHQIEHAEAPRIVEAQPPRRRRSRRITCSCGHAGRLIAEPQAPRHAEMEQQGLSSSSPIRMYLAAPAMPCRRRAGQARGEPSGNGKRRSGPALLERGDPPASQARGQARGDGLDFGQLGHRLAARAGGPALVPASALP